MVCYLVSMRGKRESFTFEWVPLIQGCPLQDTHTAMGLVILFSDIKLRGEHSEEKLEGVGGEVTARYDHMSLFRYEILEKKKFKILR